jgi:hypothetical protein
MSKDVNNKSAENGYFSAMLIITKLQNQPRAGAPNRKFSPDFIFMCGLHHIGPSKTATALLHCINAGRRTPVIKDFRADASCLHIIFPGHFFHVLHPSAA